MFDPPGFSGGRTWGPSCLSRRFARRPDWLLIRTESGDRRDVSRWVPHVRPARANVGFLTRFYDLDSHNEINLHQGSPSCRIRRITTPHPILRIAHQFPCHRIPTHVFQFLTPLRCAMDIEVIESFLPELRQLRFPFAKRKDRLFRRLFPHPSPHPLWGSGDRRDVFCYFVFLWHDFHVS